MSIEIISQQMTGTWQSIAPELRPGTQKSPAGNLQPFYLSRTFQYVDGIFDLRIDNYADPNGKYLVMRIYLAGHVAWKGPHPIAPGAQKVDFTADLKYNIMPVAPVFTEGLNIIAAEGLDKWETGREQSFLWKAFKPFGIVAGWQAG